MKRLREESGAAESLRRLRPVETLEIEEYDDENVSSLLEIWESDSFLENVSSETENRDKNETLPSYIVKAIPNKEEEGKDGKKDDKNFFITACCNGYTDIVELLLDNGVVHIEKIIDDALIAACTKNHIAVVDLLLYHENVQYRDSAQNYVALRAAILNDNLVIALKLMARKETKVNAILNDAFIFACRAGYLKTLGSLLMLYPHLFPETGEGLLEAVEFNRKFLVHLLYSQKTTIHSQITDAFFLATRKGYDEIVSILLPGVWACADTHHALADACVLDNKLLIRMLCRNCKCANYDIDFTTIFRNIIETDNSYALKQVYQKFEDKLKFKKPSKNNSNLLKFSVDEKAMKCAKFLIQLDGFDLKAGDISELDSRKLLYSFCEVDDVESVKLLITKMGIDPSSDRRIIHTVITKNSPSVLKELLKNERLQPYNFYGDALKVAMELNHVECILVLLSDIRANPNEQYDVVGWACEKQHSRVIEKLILHPKISNSVILGAAARAGETDLVRMLLDQKNHSPNVCNKEITPEDLLADEDDSFLSSIEL